MDRQLSMPSKPSPKPKYDFRTCLKKSDVLKPEVLEQWLADNPDVHPSEAASQLVREKLLTPWQAKYLLSGRYRLHLGNYQLLRRIRRDDFGDRFVALHPQLGRTVQVQVLPVELTNNVKKRAEFLKQAGLAGELDHPNLAHVFDIDKQQGRYYLVTEHNDGRSLAKLPVADLDAEKIACLTRDSIRALQYAHSHSVTHGNLTMDNVLIDENGEVKIVQIALSQLVEQSSGQPKENLTPEQSDLLAIVRMNRRLVNRLELTGPARRVSDILTRLNTKDDAAFASNLAELESWLDQQATGPEIETDPQPASIPQAESELETELTDDQPETPVNNSRSATEDVFQRRSNNAQLTPRQKSRSRKGKQSRQENSKLDLILMIVPGLAVVILGTAGYLGFRAMLQTEKPKVAIQRTRQNTSTPQSVAPTNRAPMQSPSPQATNSSVGIADKTQVERPQVLQNQASNNQASNNQAAKKLSVPSFPVTPIPQSSTNPNFVAGVESDATSNVKQAASWNDFEATNPAAATTPPAPTVPAEESDDFAATTTSAASTKTRLTAPGTSKKEPPKKTAEPETAAGPFDDFPSSADLPPTASVEEVVLAKIQQPSMHLLGMQLYAPTGIGKGRTNFELQRNETDKQQWTLLAKKSPSSTGKPVGEFKFEKLTNQITFRWLAAAVDSKIANYARNCAVKVALADDARTVALRKPLTLPDLKLTAEEPFAHLESAIEWLPDPQWITVELMPTIPEGLPETWLEPSIVQPGSPAAIHFHEAASNRFMWLQLVADIRKKASFDLKLLLKHADGTVQPIARSDDLKKLVKLLVQAARTAEQKYLENVDVVAPHGQKTKFKDYVAKLKSTAKKALRQSEIAAENINIVKSFYGRPIPLRVMLRTEVHQVVLVDTTSILNKEADK